MTKKQRRKNTKVTKSRLPQTIQTQKTETHEKPDDIAKRKMQQHRWRPLPLKQNQKHNLSLSLDLRFLKTTHTRKRRKPQKQKQPHIDTSRQQIIRKSQSLQTWRKHKFRKTRIPAIQANQTNPKIGNTKFQKKTRIEKSQNPENRKSRKSEISKSTKSKIDKSQPPKKLKPAKTEISKSGKSKSKKSRNPEN